jgi:mono/diheme cytochrome c family protein
MKWIGQLIVSTCVIVSSLAGGQATAQQTGQSGGLVLARRVCSECHAVETKTVPFPNLDAPSFNTIANTPGMTAKYLSVEFRRAHQTMPNINLNANELRDIVAYILSLQRAD